MKGNAYEKIGLQNKWFIIFCINDSSSVFLSDDENDFFVYVKRSCSSMD